MNQVRASEANKHRLEVAQALLAKGDMVKHVQHQGRSVLYVCLPALHEQFLKLHNVYIPSYAAFVKSLDHPLVLRTKQYGHRFEPQGTKAAALGYRWPVHKGLPTAEELADLLHLDETLGAAAPVPAVAGGAAVHRATPPALAAGMIAAPTAPGVPTTTNPLFQTVPKGVGLTWGRRSKAALQIRQQLWEQKQQELRQARSTSCSRSGSPQQKEQAQRKEQQIIATIAELREADKRSTKEQPDKTAPQIPAYMLLPEEKRKKLKEQLQSKRQGAEACRAARVVADTAATAPQQQGSAEVAVAGGCNDGASSGAGGDSSSGNSGNLGNQHGATCNGKSSPSAAAATPSTAAASAPADSSRQQQECSLISKSRTGSSNNLLAGQQQQQLSPKQQQEPDAGNAATLAQQPATGRQQGDVLKRQSEQVLQLQQQDLPVQTKRQRSTMAVPGSGSHTTAAAAAAPATVSHQQQQQNSKPRVQRLPRGMQVAHMAAVRKQHRQRGHGQQQEAVPCSASLPAPKGSQQVMQQQLKQMLGVGPEYHMTHSSFISLGQQQQQQFVATEPTVEPARNHFQRHRHLAWQTETKQQQQQQQQLQRQNTKPSRVLPLPVAMQMGNKTEQQRQQLLSTCQQVWQHHQQRLQQTGQHLQQRSSTSEMQFTATHDDVERSTRRQLAGRAGQTDLLPQPVDGHLSGQPDGHPSGQPGAHLSGQPGAHLSGQPDDNPSGQPGAHLSSQPAVHASGQSAEAAARFSMKAVFSGKQMKRLQLLKQQQEDGMTTKQQQPGMRRQQEPGLDAQLQQQQQQQQSLPLKRKAIETSSHLLRAAAAASCGQSFLPPPQRCKRVSSDAGSLSTPQPRVDHTLKADELDEVQSLLAAVSVMVGASSLQHLVAAIDQLMLPQVGCDVQQQSGRDQAAHKQQQQHVLDLPASNAAAAAGTARPSVASGANDTAGISNDLLCAVRWLALKLASMQQQQLMVPTLQQLCKRGPCLLDGMTTLDGASLLCLTEDQLQDFLAAVLDLQRQQCMQPVCRTSSQRGSSGADAKELLLQQQGTTGDTEAGSTGNVLVQQQQQRAAALMSEWRARRGVLRCRPTTLMLLIADKMMAAVVQETKQREPRVCSPQAQAAAAAGVTARLAKGELQLAAAATSAAGAISGKQLAGVSAASADGNYKQLAGSSSTAVAAESADDPLVSSSSSTAPAGLQLLNSFLLRNQFHPELQARQLSVDMSNRCLVAAAAVGTTEGPIISAAALLVFAFSLQENKETGVELPAGAAHAVQAAGAVMERKPVAEQKRLRDQVLASWLCIAPDVQLWRELVRLLLQLQQQQQQQDESGAGKVQQHEQLNLQQCYAQAQELLRSMPLQPGDILDMQQHLKELDQSHERQQYSRVVVLLQTPGCGVLLQPGWLHLQVNHVQNVTLWFEVLRACDAGAAAVVQRDLPWLQKAQQQSTVHVGPLVLKTLQQWHTYCQQQQQQ